MSEQSLFILASLLGGPLHGYAIVREAADLSGGGVQLSAGTLYGALERLAREGLVENDGEETVAGRRRGRSRGRAHALGRRRLRAT